MLFRRSKANYMGWEEYKAKIDFLEMFLWQQSVRRANLKA